MCHTPEVTCISLMEGPMKLHSPNAFHSTIQIGTFVIEEKIASRFLCLLRVIHDVESCQYSEFPRLPPCPTIALITRTRCAGVYVTDVLYETGSQSGVICSSESSEFITVWSIPTCPMSSDSYGEVQKCSKGITHFTTHRSGQVLLQELLDWYEVFVSLIFLTWLPSNCALCCFGATP